MPSDGAGRKRYVFSEQERRADWRDVSVSWCDRGSIIAPEWQLGVIAQHSASCFTTSQGQLNSIWTILILENLAVWCQWRAYSWCTTWRGNLILVWGDSDSLSLHKGDVGSMWADIVLLHCKEMVQHVLFTWSHVFSPLTHFLALEGNICGSGSSELQLNVDESGQTNSP